MADQDPNEFVRMSHPSVNAPSGLVTRQAFEEVHQHKGWVIVPDDATTAPAEAAPAPSKPAK